MKEKRTYFLAIGSIALSFALWACLFIYRSSFIAIDGKRYFSLFDDAMISLRYAWNFAHGLGLVWNQGQYIEGYTNPLMTLLMSIPARVFDKSSAVLSIQISGIVFMLGIASLTVQISDHLDMDQQHRPQFRILSFLCALSYYPLAFWTLEGMETGLLTFLLLLSVVAVLNYTRQPRGLDAAILTVSLALAYLTRPDSAIPAVVILIYLFYETKVSKMDSPIGVGYVAGVYLLVIIALEVFRWNYYGDLLPNTYTLKLVGMPLLTRIGNGLGFVMQFIKEIAVPLMIIGLGLVFNFQRQKLFFISVLASLVCYQIYVGGDAWTYWRILSPAMPIVLVVLVHTLIRIVEFVSHSAAFRTYFLHSAATTSGHFQSFLMLMLAFLALFIVNLRFIWEILPVDEPYETNSNHYGVNVALALNQLTSIDATIGVFTAGGIPYYTDRTAIDFLGKSDRYIAQLAPDLSGRVGFETMNSLPGHNKYDLNYSIKRLKPTYVQMFKWGNQDLSDWQQSYYATVQYKGIWLSLLKDSKAVVWSKITDSQ